MSIPAQRLLIKGSEVGIYGAPGITKEEISLAIESTPFKLWQENLESASGLLTAGGSGGAKCKLRGVTIQSVDMFGKRVGFVKFFADIIDDQSGAKLPGIVFARGGAVGIMILLSCGNQKSVVLIEQARVPIGRSILELPAGMLDDDAGDFTGTAAREVEEEVGIKINKSELINLTDFLDESTKRIFYPSPGGCDEEITIFLCEKNVPQEVINKLQGSETGLRSHGELIKVHLVPYKDLWKCSPDAKVLAAVALYEGAKRDGLLPSCD